MAGPRTGIAGRIFSKLGEEPSTERTCVSPRTEGFASLRKVASSQLLAGPRTDRGLDSKRASIPCNPDPGPRASRRLLEAGRQPDRFDMYATRSSLSRLHKH